MSNDDNTKSKNTKTDNDEYIYTNSVRNQLTCKTIEKMESQLLLCKKKRFVLRSGMDCREKFYSRRWHIS